MNPVIIIPARMASTRLPGKPLAEISGLPMIVHVMNRAVEADLGDVYVACSEREVAQAVESRGGKAILTDPDLPSGTDRIKQALERINHNTEYDVIINVQGDLPTIDPQIIRKSLLPFEDNHIEITTLAAKITDKEEINNPNVVKAVVAWKENSEYGKALYFTRATAPANEGDLYHHIGLYAYRRDALEKFTSLPPSPLEKREKLEQLRALENNITIGVVRVDTIPFGVDTQEDLAKARSLLGG